MTTTYLSLFVGILLVLLFTAAVVWVRRTFFATTASPYIDTAAMIFGLVIIVYLLLTAVGLWPFHDQRVPQVR